MSDDTSPTDPTEFDVRDVPASDRFELRRAGELLGFAEYVTQGVDGDGPPVVIINHVNTNPAHRGQGHAARLMDGIVGILRDREQKMVPVCSYAVRYVQIHDDLSDVVA